MAEWFDKVKSDFILNFITSGRWKLLFRGLGNTLVITFFALLLGILIGIVVAAVCSSYDKNKEVMSLHRGAGYYILRAANAVCRFYLTVIRGTPAVVQLMIWYFIIFASSNNPNYVAIICFGVNSGAYVAEIFRSGIMAVDPGQAEAGRSLGFSYFRTMAYIVVPQAFKTVLPTLGNEFIALIKETSIAGYVGIMDLTKAGDLIRNRTYSAFMPLIAVALVYLVLVIILTRLVGLLERRLRRSER